MGATLATVDAILKEVYEPRIRNQLENEVVALRRIERSSEGVSSQVGGKYVVFPIHVARNTGIGARLEDELLPVAGNQAYKQARVGLRYLYGRLRLTGQTIELADSNFQAFASAMDEEVNRIKDDLAKDLNRQVYGDGSGVLATLTGAAGAATANSVQYVQVGELVDTGTVANGIFSKISTAPYTVTSVDVATKGVVLGGSGAGYATGQVIVRTTPGGSAAAPGLAQPQREWTGLGKIVGSGLLFNIDGATEPVWRSQIFTGSPAGTARPLSEGLITLACDAVRAAGSKTTVLFTNLGVRRAYANLLTQQRRYTNTTVFEGGFSGLEFTTDAGSVPMVVDTDCPYNTIYGLNEKELKVYRESDWGFMNRDGSNWARIQDRDAYEATLYQYSELGVHRRNAQFKITDITEA